MFYNDPIAISSETWCKLLIDKSITTDADYRVLELVYKSTNHEACGSDIASELGMSHHGPLNLQVSRFSKRVVRKTGINPPIGSHGKTRWWHIPFLGYEKAGHFPWIMRQELVMAFEKVYDVPEREIVFLDEVPSENAAELVEGMLKQVSVNRYERNRRARNICIAHYGTKCLICGFDFEKTYGPVGKNKIHVHHITPLSKIGRDYVVDPIGDLKPVCPNCHTIIHSKSDPFTIDEVRAILKGQRNNA